MIRNIVLLLFLLFIANAKASYFSSVTIDNSLNDAYGQQLISQETPVVSGDAIYNFIPSNFRTFSAGAGTVVAEDGVFKVTSGSTLGSYGALRSFRSINHKSAQGSTVRFSGRFVSNVALSWSGIGGFTIGDEYSFGYNGTSFGVWHRYGGKAEIQTLTVSVAASGSETLTVNLNSVSFSIPVTSGTTQHNAYEIATYLEANASDVNVEQLDSTIVISYLSDGDKTGTFSCSSSGALTCAFSETTAGVTKTSAHVAMSSWNKKPNGFTGFNPSQGNSYQIVYQSGYGNIKYFILNPSKNKFELVHEVEWVNDSTKPNLNNPSIHLGLYATSLSTITPIEVHMSHITGFLNGKLAKTRNPRAFRNTKISVGTSFTNILTIRNSFSYNGLANQVQIQPLVVHVTNDGNKQAECVMRANPDVAGEPNFQAVGTNLVSQSDIAGTTVSSNGRLLTSFPVARLNSTREDLIPLEIVVPPSLSLVLACRLVSGTGDISASLVWYEDL